MAQTADSARAGADTPRRIETIIAQYPAVEPADLEFLLDWYRNHASAYDIGMLAANPDIVAGYGRFRADHIDRITPADMLKAVVWVTLVVGSIAAVLWLAH